MSHEVPPELSFEDLWYEYLFRAHKFFEASLGLARGELGAVMDGSLRLAPKGDAIDQRIRIDQAARNSRHAVLFTSLGAEAYINAVSAEQLSNRDADAVDRLDPGSKWHLIPRLAFGREVFDPAREPLQSVTTLFKARNRLVHAKRGEWVEDPSGRPAHYDLYNPHSAASWLMRVVEAVWTLEAEAGRPEEDGMEYVSISGLESLLPAAKAVTRFPLPTPDDVSDAQAALRSRTEEPG